MITCTPDLQNKKAISPLLYGIFFEDLNYAGDGGLYGELVANRSFEYFDKDGREDLRFLCWETFGEGTAVVSDRLPINMVHRNFVKLSGEAGFGIRNAGFCKEGLAVHTGQEFRFSVFARNAAPMKLTIRLVDKDGVEYSSRNLSLVRVGCGFSKYFFTLTATGDAKNVYLEVSLFNEGSVDLDVISLFPKDTYKGRINGLRKDMAEMLEDLHPKFMRFPGGCIVEGRSFPNMYNWKETVGPVENRVTNWNRWQTESFYYGDAPDDYFQSYGLGFFEYFCLCEDLGAKPIPVINAGMTCQWHEALLVDLNEMDKWIQDACDLIEFANGPVDSTWGKVRADMGHPEPFGLEYLSIGNEQWGKEYFERYELFEKVLSKKHPEIKLITCAGWSDEGWEIDLAYEWLKDNKDKAYAIDEHYYKAPEWFLSHIDRYDAYDRTLPKVFAGEYAAHTAPEIINRESTWCAALCEAAFMTGLERNADHVVLSSYAPLFGRSNHYQWQPNMIWFDNDSIYGTASYYVQKLFANHTGETYVPMQFAETPAECTLLGVTLPSIHTSVTLSADEKTMYVKLVNLADTVANVSFNIAATVCEAIQLCASLTDKNSHEEPRKVFPVTLDLPKIPGELSLPAYSLTVLTLSL